MLALRVRPARVRRPLRRLARDGGADRRARRVRAGRARRRPRPRRRASRRSRSSRAASSPATPSGCGALESGDLIVVGVNRFTEALPSPLEGEGSILEGRPGRGGRDRRRACSAWRSERDNDAVKRSIERAAAVAESGENMMAATIDLAHAGGTTGEWAGTLREVFGEYRAPTGVAAAAGVGRRQRRARAPWPSADRPCPAARRGSSSPSPASTATATAPSRSPSPPATPAWRSSTRASGSRRSRSRPSRSTRTSTSSACRSCRAATSELVPRGRAPVPRARRRRPGGGRRHHPGGRPTRARSAAGVAAVYTPKDFELTKIMGEIVDLAITRRLIAGPRRPTPPPANSWENSRGFLNDFSHEFAVRGWAPRGVLRCRSTLGPGLGRRRPAPDDAGGPMPDVGVGDLEDLEAGASLAGVTDARSSSSIAVRLVWKRSLWTSMSSGRASSRKSTRPIQPASSPVLICRRNGGRPASREDLREA